MDAVICRRRTSFPGNPRTPGTTRTETAAVMQARSRRDRKATQNQDARQRPIWHPSLTSSDPSHAQSVTKLAGALAQVATSIMDRTGLAPDGDDGGVRWVAVRHAADHVHLVATLARQDGARPRIWNDFYRVREACREAEQQLGLAVTAPADRTAARRPTRGEAEPAVRRGG